MLEFAKLLHDAFGSNWPKTFVVLAALLGALLFGGTAYLVVMAARKTAGRNPAEAGDLFAKDSGKSSRAAKPQDGKPSSNARPEEKSAKKADNQKNGGKKTPAKVEQHSQGENSPDINIEQKSFGPNSPNIVTGQVNINADWILPPDKLEQLKSLLDSSNGPIGRVSVICVFGSGDCRLGQQLWSILVDRGWIPSNGSVAFMAFSGTPEGVFIRVKSSSAAAQRLQVSLGAVGIGAQGWIDDSMSADEIQLIVGYRPR